MNKLTYKELTNAKVSKNKTVVVSSCSKGGYTLAQKIKVKDEDGKEMDVFLKGAFMIESLDGLYELRDAINTAIDEIENGSEKEDWKD